MDWQEVTVKTDKSAVEAIADLFYSLRSGGVIIEDPELLRSMAQSGKWDAYELPEEKLRQEYYLIKGYFPVDYTLTQRIEDLRIGAQEITSRLAINAPEIFYELVKEEDWANSWKAFFKPVKLGEKIVIRPSWEKYEPKADEIVIDIDPGMAFGTGNHATTSMCVELLEKYLQKKDNVIDVGTGSGILAMSAARLGAQEVLAMDYDSVAVKVAQENIENNNLQALIEVMQNDLLHGIKRKGEIIVANIIADIIIKLIPQVENNITPGGLFIASGIILDRKRDVFEACIKYGYELVEERITDDWVAQVWKIKG